MNDLRMQYVGNEQLKSRTSSFHILHHFNMFELLPISIFLFCCSKQYTVYVNIQLRVVKRMFSNILERSKATHSVLVESSLYSIFTKPFYFGVTNKKDLTYSLLPGKTKFYSFLRLPLIIAPFRYIFLGRLLY